ncbi:DNA helicase Pif1 like protein, partial [Russula dissimulans]
HAIEAVDRTLQDVRSNPLFFGGITVVLGGDFRQTLPVIPHGTREDVPRTLWKFVNVLHLTTNMRIDR